MVIVVLFGHISISSIRNITV